MRNTKIVCTLGPASDAVEDIEALTAAGMSVARLNASHGTREHRATVLDRVRRADETGNATLATMLDLPGPEIRTAPLDDPVDLAAGTEVRFVEGDTATPEEIGLSVSLAGVEPGDSVLLDDGRIEVTVTRLEGEAVVARVEDGGELGGRMSVNVSGVDLGLAVPTEQDRRELELAIEKGVDFVAASFVGDGADVYAVAETLEALGADAPVVAKIERADAVANLDGIVEEAYGVMVARGDLGVECPLEQVPLIQKRIIRTCHRAGVPVITATEMLDSMVHARRPTRAEATDVANAVLDGTDAVMLSAETAVGDHPVRVVETMDRIIRDVETSEEYAEAREQRVPPAGEAQTDALARSARFLARDVGASAVVAATESGYTALKAAKYRPPMPVVAATPDDRVRRRLALSWGVVPVFRPLADDAESVIIDAVQAAIETGAAESGDTVVALAGMMTDLEDNITNTLKVHVAAEVLASGRAVVEGHASGPAQAVVDGDLSDLPDGAVAVLSAEFDAEFSGNLDKLTAIVDARPGQTSYAAMVARELGIPMISGAALEVPDGTPVRLDAEHGIIYEDSGESPDKRT